MPLDMMVRAADATVRHAGPDQPVEISVLVTDDEEMRRLNLQYRGKDSTTDVLSFSLREDSPGAGRLVLPPNMAEPLGDVIVSYPRALAQAAEVGRSLDHELSWLIVHGTLQLLGYRHDTDAEEETMRAQERAVLHALGYD